MHLSVFIPVHLFMWFSLTQLLPNPIFSSLPAPVTCTYCRITVLRSNQEHLVLFVSPHLMYSSLIRCCFHLSKVPFFLVCVSFFFFLTSPKLPCLPTQYYIPLTALFFFFTSQLFRPRSSHFPQCSSICSLQTALKQVKVQVLTPRNAQPGLIYNK